MFIYLFFLTEMISVIIFTDIKSSSSRLLSKIKLETNKELIHFQIIFMSTWISRCNHTLFWHLSNRFKWMKSKFHGEVKINKRITEIFLPCIMGPSSIWKQLSNLWRIWKCRTFLSSTIEITSSFGLSRLFLTRNFPFKFSLSLDSMSRRKDIC